MSHRSGITTSPDLEEKINLLRKGKHRLLQILIENEKLEAGKMEKPDGDQFADLDSQLAPLTKENECFYVIYRLDSKNSLGYDFVLFTYINDSAPVRSKMIYASTLSALKTKFGSGHIKRELSVSSPDELTADGYRRQMAQDEVAAPLTESEILKNEIKQLEVSSSVTTRTETVPGLSFKVTQAAADNIRSFVSGKVDYVKFNIDTDKEIIDSSLSKCLNTESIESEISPESPNYHLFKFKYKHASKSMEKIIFVYSIPSEATIPIKEKMLYASCKSSFVSGLSSFGIANDALLSIEIDTPVEVSPESLYKDIHPETIPVKKPFAKPAGPARRPRTKR